MPLKTLFRLQSRRPLRTSTSLSLRWRVMLLAMSMVAMVVIIVCALFFILNYTRLGLRIRAGTLDLETVSVLGVNVRVLRNLNFGLGIYMAGLAGVLAAGMLPLHMRNLMRPEFLEKSGALLFIWTLYVLGVTGAFSVILAVQALRNRRVAS